MTKNYSLGHFQFAFVLLFGCLTTVWSQIAIVDNCAMPNSLPVNTSCVANNYSMPASFTNDGPAGCGTSYRDGWYTFTTDAVTTTVQITGTSDRQLGLAVYALCGGPAIACAVPGTANAGLTAAVLPATTYRLRIMRTNNANNNVMAGMICINTGPAAPGNDNCAGATPLTAGTTCSYATYSTTGATSSSTPDPGCALYVGNDVWFSMSVPASGSFVVDTQTVIQAWQSIREVADR